MNSKKRFRLHHLIWIGAVALLVIALGACDLGPAPTPTVPPPSPSPTAPPPPTATTAPTAATTNTPKPPPTATIEPSPTATPTPPPAPTATQIAFRYEAPRLKEPKNDGGYGGQLIWEPFDLAEDEYYHIFVYSIHNKTPWEKGHDTDLGKKEGKYLLPREVYGDKDNNWKTFSDSGEFTWQVQVMRRLASGESVPISPPSETWSFFWYKSTD